MKIFLKENCNIKKLNINDFFATKKIISQVMKLYQKKSTSLKKNEKIIKQGISEIIINAIEHGAIGLGSQKKYELKRKGIYETYLNNVISNCNKSIDVEYVEEKNNITLIISDFGNGFEWKKHLIAVETKKDGTGLWLAKNSFDELTYNTTGNSAKAVVYKDAY
ncbi:hypothetical protein DID74_02710 [Candidatus Marinamargulisbacteria bacterium SCGC AG-333-B06]|nr:hypothetical protein DID74_02710 [Candidatus Marinamargulisbacteria bacterium SCGC AG-333-B06]